MLNTKHGDTVEMKTPQETLNIKKEKEAGNSLSDSWSFKVNVASLRGT